MPVMFEPHYKPFPQAINESASQPVKGQLKLYTLTYSNTNPNTNPNPNVHKT